MHKEEHATRGLWSFILAILAFAAAPIDAAPVTLIHFGSPWRYYDFGSDPGVNWFATGYSDGNWKFNFAEFGHGDGDEQTTTAPATTTYFRTFRTITNAESFLELTLSVVGDDGVAVYINGTEVLRHNLPATPLAYETLALAPVDPPAESEAVVTNLSASLLQEGVNLFAAEVHQAAPLDADMSFNLQLTATVSSNAPGPVTLTRGPYLQVGTSSNIIVRWRTSSSTDSLVQFGTNASNLDRSANDPAAVTDHEIRVDGLLPDTKYFYRVGSSTQIFAADESYYFITSPVPGTTRPVRIWAIGDFGTGFSAQRNVRNAYTNFSAGRHTDAWLFLGDNAYQSGYDHEYQSYVFDVYPRELRRFVVWPAIGNHETAQSQALRDDFDYYRIFTMPTNGEAGGLASGTEHYYSFDYANIHFVVLDSMTAIYRQPGSAMAEWLRADLAETTRDWIIAYFHHPPYTKGSHNSDAETDLVQIRSYIVPILEEGGVDLVLAGHSHCYERSYLLDGHYGFSSSISDENFVNSGDGRTNGAGAYLKPAAGMGSRGGTVYVVDGSSGGQGGGGSLDHPAMFYSTLTYGSLVIDVHGLRLDAAFVAADGSIDDTFTILKDDYPGAPQPALEIDRLDGNHVTLRWPTSVPDYRLEWSDNLAVTNWTPVPASIQTNGRRKSVSLPGSKQREFFRLRRE